MAVGAGAAGGLSSGAGTVAWTSTDADVTAVAGEGSGWVEAGWVEAGWVEAG
jgi:hypothetical protein